MRSGFYHTAQNDTLLQDGDLHTQHNRVRECLERAKQVFEMVSVETLEPGDI